MRISRLALIPAAALAFAAPLAACSSDDSATNATTESAEVVTEETAEETEATSSDSSSSPVQVVATTTMLGDVAAQIVACANPESTATTLMPIGADPHDFAPSSSQVAQMVTAQVVIANGLGLEAGLDDALENAASDGATVIEIADLVDPIPFGAGGHDDHGHSDAKEDDHDDHDHDDEHSDDDHSDDEHSDDEHGHDDAKEDDHSEDEHSDDDHDHGDEDPHFWFDPLRMADAVDIIATDLATLRSDVDWAARAAELRSELEGVDAEMAALFATIPADRRLLVTNHDALGYLEARYGLEVVGTIVPGTSTTVETNPRAFADLVDLLVAEGIDVIFAETTDTTTLAEQLASEVIGRGDLDVQVVQLYTGALGEPGSGAETYLGLLRTTARAITDALA